MILVEDFTLDFEFERELLLLLPDSTILIFDLRFDAFFVTFPDESLGFGEVSFLIRMKFYNCKYVSFLLLLSLLLINFITLLLDGFTYFLACLFVFEAPILIL